MQRDLFETTVAAFFLAGLVGIAIFGKLLHFGGVGNREAEAFAEIHLFGDLRGDFRGDMGGAGFSDSHNAEEVPCYAMAEVTSIIVSSVSVNSFLPEAVIGPRNTLKLH